MASHQPPENLPMTRSRTRITRSLILLLLVTSAHGAMAQNHAADAEQRFRDGKKLMAEKKFAEACDAFETSNRLDPSTSTLANLADCREKNGQIQSAWTAFLTVERELRNDKSMDGLHKTAKARAKDLEARLSYLTVSVARGSDIDGLTLTRNGEAFDPGLWNTAIPVDGGSYTIAGRAPGHEEWSTTVTVPAEGGRIGVDVPRFKEVEELVGGPPAGADDEDAPLEGDAAQSMFTGRRKLAIGIGAAGLLAVGAGIVLGMQASGFDDDASQLCPTLTGCAAAAEANALVDKARSRAVFANISYVIGGAAVIAAAVLWFTGAPDERAGARTAVAPVITPTSVGLDVAVRF